jgi:hypothetical protein
VDDCHISEGTPRRSTLSVDRRRGIEGRPRKPEGVDVGDSPQPLTRHGPFSAWPSRFQIIPVSRSRKPSGSDSNDSARPATTELNMPVAPIARDRSIADRSSADSAPETSDLRNRNPSPMLPPDPNRDGSAWMGPSILYAVIRLLRDADLSQRWHRQERLSGGDANRGAGGAAPGGGRSTSPIGRNYGPQSHLGTSRTPCRGALRRREDVGDIR